jgi:hypothetical protein
MSNQESAACCLGTLDPGNELAITTLIGLLNSEPRSSWRIAQSLGRIAIHQQQAVVTLIEFVQTFSDSSNWHDRQVFANYFKQITSIEILSMVVNELKDYLHPEQQDSVRQDIAEEQEAQVLENRYELEGDRIEVCQQIIWNCSQNMSYMDFHSAWHTSQSSQALQL